MAAAVSSQGGHWEESPLRWSVQATLGYLSTPYQDPGLTVSLCFCSYDFSATSTSQKTVQVRPPDFFLHYQVLHLLLPVATRLTASHLFSTQLHTLRRPVPQCRMWMNLYFLALENNFSTSHGTYNFTWAHLHKHQSHRHQKYYQDLHTHNSITFERS